MKRKLSISLTFIFVSISMLFFSMFISDGGLFLRMDLTSDYSLRKELFANTYNLVNKEDGSKAIKNIGDWIITDQYIYGRLKTGESFF